MMGRMFKMVIIGGLAAVMLTGCYGRIETGHVGVRTDFNKKIDVEEVPPGFYGAVFSTVDDFVAKEIEIPMDDLTPKAKDNLSLAELDVSIFYVPTPGKIADMVVKYSGMSPKAKSGNYLPSYVLIERYTRDTFGFAMKATHGVVNGEHVEILKSPKTDTGMKKSAVGLLRVEKEGDNFVLYDRQTPEQEQQGELKTVYKNGTFTNLENFANIRNRLRLT